MRKPFLRLLVAACIVTLLAPAAHAARLGGGKSSSGARPSTPVAPMQRQAPDVQRPPMSTFPQQQGPGQQAPAPLPQQQIPRQAPAPQPSRFGGVGGFLGGLLAGGLLGSLFFGGSHGTGMSAGGGGGGGGFGFLFDLLLIGGLIWFLYRFVFRRKSQQEEPLTAPPMEQQASYTHPQGSPDPWDNLRTQPQAQQSTPPTAADYGFGQAPQAAQAGQAAPAVDLPPGFNAEEFLKGAKAVYVRLQSSWDRRDLKDLESFCAPAMLKDIKDQAAADPKPGRTDILMLEATLAAVNREGDNTVASVVFDAQLREDAAEGLKDVRELWHFIRDETKPGSNWVLYGIEQAQ